MEEEKRSENSKEEARSSYSDRLGYEDNTSKEQINYSTKHTSYRDNGKNKFEEDYERKRGRRAFNSVWNIIWSLAFIIFFNFFSNYIAYYQYEWINGSLNWHIFPVITSNFQKLIPMITATLLVIMVSNIIILILDKYVLSKILEIIGAILAIAVYVNVLLIFPFDFNILPYDKMAEILPLVVKSVIGFIILILVVQIISNFVKIVMKIART